MVNSYHSLLLHGFWNLSDEREVWFPRHTYGVLSSKCNPSVDAMEQVLTSP